MGGAADGGARVLPAYAGMILTFSHTTKCGRSAPRVCGDDPFVLADHSTDELCSPRMRG